MPTHASNNDSKALAMLTQPTVRVSLTHLEPRAAQALVRALNLSVKSHDMRVETRTQDDIISGEKEASVIVYAPGTEQIRAVFSTLSNCYRSVVDSDLEAVARVTDENPRRTFDQVLSVDVDALSNTKEWVRAVPNPEMAVRTGRNERLVASMFTEDRPKSWDDIITPVTDPEPTPWRDRLKRAERFLSTRSAFALFGGVVVAAWVAALVVTFA